MKRFVINNMITSVNTNSLKLYLKEVSSFNVFTREEENECLKRIENGDKKAVEELINRNLRFVISVAKKYSKNNVELEDLINEGNIGLMMAIDSFKKDMNIKFISYAVWWIRKVILDYLYSNSRLVKIPTYKIKTLLILDKKITEYEQKFKRNVDFNEIIDELDKEMSNSEIKEEINYKRLNEEFELLQLLNGNSIRSLNQIIFEDDNNLVTYGDVLKNNDPKNNPDYQLINDEFYSFFENNINKLTQRDRYVIVNYFGLFNTTPKQLREIAKEIGVSTEMARQIKEKSLDKLRILFC